MVYHEIKIFEKEAENYFWNSGNTEENLCDSWGLSTSVEGTGSFSASTVTHSISESAP